MSRPKWVILRDPERGSQRSQTQDLSSNRETGRFQDFFTHNRVQFDVLLENAAMQTCQLINTWRTLPKLNIKKPDVFRKLSAS